MCRWRLPGMLLARGHLAACEAFGDAAQALEMSLHNDPVNLVGDVLIDGDGPCNDADGFPVTVG